MDDLGSILSGAIRVRVSDALPPDATVMIVPGPQHADETAEEYARRCAALKTTEPVKSDWVACPDCEGSGGYTGDDGKWVECSGCEGDEGWMR